jgi:hypothetical protein
MKEYKMKSVKTNAIGNIAKSLVSNEVPADPVLTIGADEQTMLVEYVQISNQASNKNQQLADLLYSHGKRSYHFVGANDDDKGLVAFRNKVIGVLVKGFDADAQKLYYAEPKTLSMSKQVEQTVIKTKIVPTLFGNIKKAMAKLENNIASGKTEKAKPKTKEQMAKQALLQFIKYAKESKNCWEGFSKDIEMAQSFSVLKQIK